MRGIRLSRASKIHDVVLVAVRYESNAPRLSLAQAYERMGEIWSDLRSLNREEVIQRLGAGRRVVIGKPRLVPGDFDVHATVSLERVNGGEGRIMAEGQSGDGDRLGLPLF